MLVMELGLPLIGQLLHLHSHHPAIDCKDGIRWLINQANNWLFEIGHLTMQKEGAHAKREMGIENCSLPYHQLIQYTLGRFGHFKLSLLCKNSPVGSRSFFLGSGGSQY